MKAMFVESSWLSLAIVLLIGSIFLFRRAGGSGPFLQLVGSAALFLAFLLDFAVSWVSRYGYDYGLGDPLLLLRSLERPLVYVPLNILRVISLCFPVGFLWYALRLRPPRI